MESRFLSTVVVVVVQLPRIVRRRWSNDFRERWGTHACVRWPRTKLIRKLSRRRRGARRGKAAMRIHHEDSPRARRASPSAESWLLVSAKGEKKKKKEKSTTLPFLFPFVPHSSYILSYLFFFLPPGIFIRCNFFFHSLLSSSLLLHFSLFLSSFLSLALFNSFITVETSRTTSNPPLSSSFFCNDLPRFSTRWRSANDRPEWSRLTRIKGRSMPRSNRH